MLQKKSLRKSFFCYLNLKYTPPTLHMRIFLELNSNSSSMKFKWCFFKYFSPKTIDLKSKTLKYLSKYDLKTFFSLSKFEIIVEQLSLKTSNNCFFEALTKIKLRFHILLNSAKFLQAHCYCLVSRQGFLGFLWKS